MKQLVLDAGPLIALFYAKDIDHDICKAGFEQLSQSQTILLTPIPVVFDVYKWLLYSNNRLNRIEAAIEKTLPPSSPIAPGYIRLSNSSYSSCEPIQYQ